VLPQRATATARERLQSRLLDDDTYTCARAFRTHILAMYIIAFGFARLLSLVGHTSLRPVRWKLGWVRQMGTAVSPTCIGIYRRGAAANHCKNKRGVQPTVVDP
jgi:hypothetical protein